MISGVMDFGWVFFDQASLQAAVREGARMGVTKATTASPDPRATAISRVNTVLNEYHFPTSGRTVTATYSGASPNQLLRVTAAVHFTPLIGLVPHPSTLTSSLTMLLEQQP